MPKTIYQALKEKGLKLSNYRSDLYVEANEETIQLAKDYGHSFSVFTSKTNGKRMIDIPFAYDPYWEKRGMHNGN